MLHTKTVALLAVLALIACATPRIEAQPIDWKDAGEPWSLHIVTLDADGEERVTRIWIAAVDGAGALRTGDSLWWQNLQRDPAGRIRIDGVDFPVRAEFVSVHAEKVRIDEAFAVKYGWMENMMFPQEPGETHENYAHLHGTGTP